MTTCIYCNGEIPEGAKFCTNCGAALPVEAPAQQPAFGQAPEPPYQQPAQPQPYQQSAYQQPYGQAPAKSATMLIVLSVLEFLFCGGLLAIIPLVFAIQASSAYKVGDIAGGDAKAKTAKTALIIVLVIALAAYVALVGFGGCSALLS